MIQLIGTENCSRCSMVKTVLDNKSVAYTYQMIDSFSVQEQEKLLDMAKEVGQMSFPLIIKEDKIITLQEV